MENSKKNSSQCVQTLGANGTARADQNINNSLPENQEIVNKDCTATIPWDDLEEFVLILKKHITRAECLLHEIAFDYFGQPNEEIEKNNFLPLWGEYDTYSTKADIVAETLFSMRKMAQQAEAFVYSEEMEGVSK